MKSQEILNETANASNLVIYKEIPLGKLILISNNFFIRF